MTNCNVIPSVGNSNLPSRVFQGVLGFKNIINENDLKDIGLGINNIRDLATYIFSKSTNEDLINSGVELYEDTQEVKLENVIKYIIKDSSLSEKSLKVFNKMIEVFNTPLKSFYDGTIKYDMEFTNSDISYSNLVLAQCYLELQDNFNNSKIKTQLSLKAAIINQLNKNISKYNEVKDPYKEKFIESYLFNILKKNSVVWKSFLKYLKNTYGVDYRNVKHDYTLEDREGTFQVTDDIQEVWDAIKQDKIDRKNTISAVVKSKLAKLLNDVSTSNSTSNKLYIPQPMDINTVWNNLINLHINDLTETDIYSSLESASTQIKGFSKIKEIFDRAKEGDLDAQNFKSAYISGIKLAVIPSNHLAIDDNFIATFYTNNKGAFAQTAYINRFISVIDTNLKYNLYKKGTVDKLQAKLETETINKKRIVNEESTVNSLMNVYNELGLAVTRRALESYLQKQSDVKQALTTLVEEANYIVSEIQSLVSGKIKIQDYTNEVSNNRGNLYRLAGVASYDFDSLTNLSYLDVKGELNYSPQYDSLLTSLFRGISLNGKVREEYLTYKFRPYLEDPTLYNDNLLWYDPSTGIGMFEKTNDGYKLNKHFVSSLERNQELAISQFDGLKLRNTGLKYKEIQSTMYKFTEVIANLMGKYIFLTSDSPRSYMINVNHIDTSNLYNSDETININSEMFIALKKIVQADNNIFLKAGNTIFNIDENDKSKLQNYHRVKYWNGKSILNNGIPTGKGFQFLSLTYTENQKPINIVKYIAQTLSTDENTVTEQDVYSGLIEQSKTGVENQYSISNFIDGFITKYIQFAERSVLSDFADISQYVLETSVESLGEQIKLLDDTITDEIDKLYNEKIQDIIDGSEGRLKSIDDFKPSSLESIRTQIKKEVLENTTVENNKAYKNSILKVVLNHAVYSNSFNNIINGKLSEYKNTTDYNKRIAQIIKNGLNSQISTKPRKVLVVEDMNFKNNISDLLFNKEDGIQEYGKANDIIKEAHSRPATINDSMSIMTDETLEDLLKVTGRWEEYRDIVETLRDDTKPFNPLVYNKLIEQLKLFGTARRKRSEFFKQDTGNYKDDGTLIDDFFGNEVDSVQIKDSTLVIFDSMTRGSELNNLYHWMKDNDIHQISPISAVKVSGITPIAIHDGNAMLKLPEVADNKNVLYMQSSDFVIQQDVKADLLDEHTILGSQFTKQIIQGLNQTDSIYEFDGRKLNGKELAKEFQIVLSKNIQEDAINLLEEIGAISEDGTINLDSKGNILASPKKLTKILQQIVEDDDSSLNIKEAITLDDRGITRLPLSYPVTFKKFERILASRFSKNVINQKLPGLHAPIRSDIFNSPNLLISKDRTIIQGKEEYDKIIDEYVKNGTITYSKDFINKCKAENRSLELRASYGYNENGQLINRAEVLLNPWMSEFYDNIPLVKRIVNEDGSFKEILTVDIDSIPKEAREMFGIRIPTEGKQSMVLFEVVGFINSGATQAIFPQSLVTQTGWDFDIDTIYAYYKHINFEQGKYSIPKFNEQQQAKINIYEANFVGGIQTYKRELKRQKYEQTKDSSLNSSLFDMVCKYFTINYNLDNSINSINNIKNNIELIKNITEDKTQIENLDRILDLFNTSIVRTINSITSDITSMITLKNSLSRSIKMMESIKGRELSQEEKVKLLENVGENYKTEDLELQRLLDTIDDNISTFKHREGIILNVLSTLETDVNLSNSIKGLKTSIEDFFKGSVNINTQNGNVEFNIFDKLNIIKNNINLTIKSKFPEIDLTEEDINKSRQIRDNKILDVATAVLGNVYHINDTNKPNAMDNIQKVSNRDNRIWNRSLDSLNPNNLADKIFLNIVSMGSTVLKGHSVNFDNTAAILSTINANFKEGVVRLVHIDDTPDFILDGNIKSKLNSTGNGLSKDYKEHLISLYGDKNFKYIPSRNSIRFNDKYINNNKSNTNVDLSGENVSVQLSEVTSAILDILKAGLMFNLNIDTLGVFRLLSAGVTTEKYYDVLDHSTEVNRFSYASAFIQQPAIVDVVETLNRERIKDDRFDFKKAIRFVRNDYSRKLIKYYIDNKTSDVENHNDIVKAYESKGFIKISISDIYDILTSVPKNDNDFIFEKDETNYYNTRDLIRFIKNKDSNIAENYASQLAILNNFDTYNDKASNLTSLSFVLKTEGRVDSFYSADRKASKLADYYLDKNAYNNILKSNYKNSQKVLDEYISQFKNETTRYNEILDKFNSLSTDDFFKEYPSSETGIGRRNFITKADYYYSKSEFPKLLTIDDRKLKIDTLQFDYEPSSALEVNGSDIISAIFSGNKLGYLDENNSTFKDLNDDSIYPIIQARYQFGHWLYANTFNNVFAQRSPLFRDSISTYLLQNNKSYDESARNYVESKVIEYYTQSLNPNQDSIITSGNVSNIKTILGIISDEQSKLNRGIFKELYGNVSKGISDEQFSKYTNLTLAEQINFIQSEPSLKSYINKPDFKKSNVFKFINFARNSKRNFGYDVLRVITDENNIIANDDIQNSIRIMWNSDIPYIAHTIRSLIAYTYYTNGLQYGYNISKYIPTEILSSNVLNNDYDTRVIKIGYLDPTINIGSFAERLRESENAIIQNQVDNISEALGYISRQNPSLNLKTPSYKQKSELDRTNPRIATMGLLRNSKGENVAIMNVESKDGNLRKVIFETRERVNNSKYANSEYVVEGYGRKQNIYKRHEIQPNSKNLDNTVYIYYPIGKLLQNEFTEESIIDSYNIPTDINLYSNGELIGTQNFLTYIKSSNELSIFLQTLNERFKNESNFELIVDDESSDIIDDTDVNITSDSNDISVELDNEIEPLYSKDLKIITSNNIIYSGQRLELINELANKSNDLIYIGNDNFNLNLLSNYSDKLNVVDYTKNPVLEANRISNKLKGGELLILGDAISNKNISSENTIKWSNLFISQLYNNIGNIRTLNTILNNGFGIAISQVYIDSIRNNYLLSNESDTLYSKFLDIRKPAKDGIDARNLNNASILIDAISTVETIKKVSKRTNIPNSDSILEVYKSFNNENFENGVKSALENSDFEAIRITFDKIVKIQVSITNSIDALLKSIDSININSFRNDYGKKQEYKEKLKLITQLISTFDKFKNLQVTKIEDTKYDPTNDEDLESFEKEFGAVNEDIKVLMNLYKQSNNFKQDVLYKIQDIQVQQIIEGSRNPKYATAFSKILEASRKGTLEYDKFDISKLEITEDEYRDIVSKLFSFKNMDISLAQRYLDSAFVTGVSLIDITGKQYINAQYNAKKQKDSVLDRVEAALEKVDPRFVTNSVAREAYFKQFITETGDLIDTYKTDVIYDELNLLREELNGIIDKEFFNSGFNISDETSKNIIKMLNESVDKFNNNKSSTINQLTNDELDKVLSELESLTENEREAYLKLNNYIELYYIPSVGEYPTKTLFKLEFKESAKDERYANLSDVDQEFISTIKSLIQEVIQRYNPTWIPYSTNFGNVLPYLPKSNIKAELGKYVKMPKERQDKKFMDIEGRSKFYLEANTLTTPEYEVKFDVRNRYMGEDWNDYQESVMEVFNKFYSNPNRYKVDYEIKTIKDIRKYNKDVTILNRIRKAKEMSYDIKDIMKAFTDELFNIKAINDFQIDYDLGLFSLKENEAESLMRNAMAQYEAMENRVYGANKVKGFVGVASSVMLRYSSINYMYGNYTAGIKNIMKGISDMIIESTGNGFVSSKDVKDGLGRIIKTIPTWIKELRQERSNDLYVAIIKDFDSIYQDTTDKTSSLTGTDALTKILSKVDTVGYSANNIGEFIMQFGMLLAAIKSHRVIGGKIMSFNEFYDDSKTSIISEILTDEQKKEYYKFKQAKDEEIAKYENKKGKIYGWEGDYAGEFLRLNINSLSSEQIKQFNKLSKDNKESYRKEFEKYPTLESQFELKDGRLGYKENSGLTENNITEFKERVKGINQSLHGIYNRIDRMALQDTAVGDLFMQFRKWIRPNFNRYFGRRFNKAFFNEAIGSWEVPIYKPLFDWTKYGYKMFKSNNPYANGLDYLKGTFKILSYQAKTLKHLKYYYNTLSINEQAAAVKFAKHLATVAFVAGSTLILGKLKDDDPELKDNFAYSLAMFELTALYKEVVEPIPGYGWYSTVQSVRDSTFVGENLIVSAGKVLGYTLMDVFSDSDKLYYDRGIHKGQLKRDVALKRLIPFYKQYEKGKNLTATMSFYNYYNPFN